ncbi:MAG: substrate-binding domain-containing protein [Planctomycetota bacterium]|jgi:ribose transport system substrate-binding protein|nr:substrate-binding domain-containing protein [Planctomycetota bacterium]
MTTRLFVCAAIVCALAFVTGCGDTSPAAGAASTSGAESLKIAVIPKGTTHEFWKSIHAGAVKAERELEGVTITWKGPLKEDDRTQQIEVVENFIAQGYSGIVLAPLDSKALARPVGEAVGAGIPVVIIDSGLESDAYTSFVATNNFAGGKAGGERLGALLEGKGKVVMLRYQVGSASTEQREAGFLEAMKAFPEIEIVSSDQYAGATRDSAFSAAQSLVNQHGATIQGVFTPNESSTAGMLLALRDANKAGGAIKHVGFDSSKILIEALEQGDIQGLVVQDPFAMGYLGVKNIVAHLRGEEVAKQIDTPVALVTPENLQEQAMQDLIKPPLDTYLK